MRSAGQLGRPSLIVIEQITIKMLYTANPNYRYFLGHVKMARGRPAGTNPGLDNVYADRFDVAAAVDQAVRKALGSGDHMPADDP